MSNKKKKRWGEEGKIGEVEGGGRRGGERQGGGEEGEEEEEERGGKSGEEGEGGGEGQGKEEGEELTSNTVSAEDSAGSTEIFELR